MLRTRLLHVVLAFGLTTSVAFVGFGFPVDAGIIAAVDYYSHVDPSSFLEPARLRLTLLPEIGYATPSGVLDARLSLLLYIQGFSADSIFVSPERIIREAYMGLHVGRFDIYAGHRFVHWGKVDILSPLNNVNHADTTVLSTDDPFESTLSDLLLQLRFYPTDMLYAELVYVPFLQPEVIDIEEVSIQEILQLPIPGDLAYVYDIDASFLNRTPAPYSEWANSVHVALHLLSFWFDLTCVYSNFVDQMPDFDLSGVTETMQNDGTTETHTVRGTAYPAYDRVSSLGLATSLYLGDFLLSADTAFKITGDPGGTRMEVKNSELFSVVQLERLFWQNRLRVQTNIIHRYVFDADADIVSDYSPAVEAYINAIISEYLQQDRSSQLYGLLHTDVSFLRETLTFAPTAIYGINEKVFLLMPRVSYKVNDYLTCSAGADIWFGKEGNGVLGANLAKDNAYIRARLEL